MKFSIPSPDNVEYGGIISCALENYRQISLRTGKLQANITEDWKITGTHH
jgi:hypothetical protein